MNKSKLNYFIFIFALLALCISVCFLVNAADYDLWARLIVGKHIVEAGAILKHDFLSYTPTHFWFDHEWGASTVYYLIYKLFGDLGLTVAKGVFIFLILFFVHKTIEVRANNRGDSHRILYYIFALAAAYPVLSATIRCHMFTFCFFTIWIYFLEKFRNGEKKWLFYLPFMMIFWANIHGGCISGLGLLLMYAVGEFLNKKPVKDYVLALIMSFLATFINPYGPKYVEFLLKATTMGRPIITEWHGSFSGVYLFRYLEYKTYLFVMAAAALFASFKQWLKTKSVDIAKIDKTKWILLIVTAFLSVKHVKHQPFFVITAAVFLYDEFYFLVNSVFSKLRNLLNLESEKFISTFSLLKNILVYAAVFGVSVFWFVDSDRLIHVSTIKYPMFAVEFVKQNNIKGNLLVNFPYGSYAAYKLYPNNLIYMDGRYEEVYDTKLLNNLEDFHLAKKENWDSIIKDYKTDVIIVEVQYPVYKKLSDDKNWKLVFRDYDFAVFVPTKSAKNRYIYPTPKLEYYDKTKFNTDIKFKKVNTLLNSPI